jgi:hypothetical protein
LGADSVLRFCWALYVLVPLAVVILATQMQAPRGGGEGHWVTWLGYACSLELVVMMLCSVAGYFVGLIVLGDETPIYLGFPGRFTSPTRRALAQVSTYVGAALTTYLACIGSVMFVSDRMRDFSAAIPDADPGLSGAVVHFFQSAYFVFLAVFGLVEVSAVGAAQKTLMFLVLLTGFSLVLGLLGLVFGAVHVPRVGVTTEVITQPESTASKEDVSLPRAVSSVSLAAAVVLAIGVAVLTRRRRQEGT